MNISSDKQIRILHNVKAGVPPLCVATMADECNLFYAPFDVHNRVICKA